MHRRHQPGLRAGGQAAAGCCELPGVRGRITWEGPRGAGCRGTPCPGGGLGEAPARPAGGPRSRQSSGGVTSTPVRLLRITAVHLRETQPHPGAWEAAGRLPSCAEGDRMSPDQLPRALGGSCIQRPLRGSSSGRRTQEARRSGRSPPRAQLAERSGTSGASEETAGARVLRVGSPGTRSPRSPASGVSGAPAVLES